MNSNIDVPVFTPSEGELFRKILGDEWKKLHPDIQARFEKNPVVGAPLFYTGQLSELNCSFVGKCLGFITMPFIKGALIPYSDSNFPVDIQVYSKLIVILFSSNVFIVCINAHLLDLPLICGKVKRVKCLNM